MNRLLCLLLIVAFVGCSKDSKNSTALDGKWVRVEQYINPGSGGYWKKTDDNPKVVLELREDGKVVSNHFLYSTYTSYEKLGNDSLAFTNAAGQKRYHLYSFDEGTLTINYLCIEGCGDRFRRE